MQEQKYNELEEGVTQQQLNDQWFASAIKGATIVAEFKVSMLHGTSFQRAIQIADNCTSIVFVGGNN